MVIKDDRLAKLQKVKLKMMKPGNWSCARRGEHYRPYQLFLISKQAVIVGPRMSDQFPCVAEVWHEVARAMRRPMPGAGFQRRPQKIHKNQAELAYALPPLLEQAVIGAEANEPHVDHVLAVALAYWGARFRIRLDHESFNQWAISAGSFEYFLPRSFEVEKIQLVDSAGLSIPFQVKTTSREKKV
jgi:hypothetical protein